jgi:hypothetical protein
MRRREGQRARIGARPVFGEQLAEFGAGARLLRQQRFAWSISALVSTASMLLRKCARNCAARS